MSPLGLAWSNLRFHLARTLIAILGVSFAVLLIFMQYGFFRSVNRTATMLYDHLAFDLLVVSSEHQDITRLHTFPRARLSQVRAIAGIKSVEPLTITTGTWRNPGAPSAWWQPTPPATGSGSSVFVLAAPPEAVADMFMLGGANEVFPDRASADAAGRQLARRRTVLLDHMSRPEYGSFEFFRNLPSQQIGARLNEQQVELVGEFTLGTGFNWKGVVITSEETFATVTLQPATEITFGLVRVAPGADLEEVRKRAAALLPQDIKLLNRTGANEIETDYWVKGNAIGQLLLAGATLAVAVGLIFLYQMMSADIRNRLTEFATAKALGYDATYLRDVVLWQAAILAILGFVPGAIAASGLYLFAQGYAGLPMYFDAFPAIVVLATAIAMCIGSGLLAVRKVHSADPASLF